MEMLTRRAEKTEWGTRMISLMLLLLLLLWPAGSAFAESYGNSDQVDMSERSELTPSHEAANGAGYVIDAYHMDVKVLEDRSYQVTEDIKVYFTESRHGIIRSIPLEGTIQREDGDNNDYRARISNIEVSEAVREIHEKDHLNLQIGDKEHLVTGEHSYRISYRYIQGADPLPYADEFYYNLIGNAWDTSIGNVTVNIEMPKEIVEQSAASLGFTTGTYGSQQTGYSLYHVEGSRIQARLMRILSPNEAYTVRMALPEGYFVRPIDYSFWISLIASGMLLLLAAILWLIFGRDHRVTEVVSFYPPKGYNSLDLAMAYRGRVKLEDVNSLLPYLADKGYLTIEDWDSYRRRGETFLGDSEGDNIFFHKQKDYDGQSKSERIFLRGLFAKRDRVKKKDLEGNFYLYANQIVEEENQSSRVLLENYTNREAAPNTFLLVMVLLLSFWAVFSGLFFDGMMNLVASGVFGILFAALMGAICLKIAHYRGASGKGVNLSLGGAMRGLFAFGMPSIFVLVFGMRILRSLLRNYISFFYYFTSSTVIRMAVAIVAVILCAYFMRYMPRRTRQGDQIYGQILGFRKFLETAEKDRLEMLVSENPQYFYNIIPFAYVLGVSDVWMKKFRDISMPAPSYMTTPRSFDFWDYYYFSSIMHMANHNLASSMYPPIPQSNSTGGFGNGGFGGGSGGGFSGGGSGGGGGSSW